jgi:hypothetical protein
VVARRSTLGGVQFHRIVAGLAYCALRAEIRPTSFVFHCPVSKNPLAVDVRTADLRGSRPSSRFADTKRTISNHFGAAPRVT